MKKKYLILFCLLLAILIPSQVMASKIEVRRISGTNRYATAVAVSKDSFSLSKVVIVASGENFPDALVGGTLAAQIEAPILLVRKNSIDDTVVQEIKRLKADQVYILGGEAAVGKAVEQELKGMKLNVKRVAGANRFETAGKIAELRFALRANPKEDDSMGDETFFVNAHNYPDALAAAPFVGQSGGYLYLAIKGEDIAPGTAIGGPSVVTHSLDNDPEASNEWEYDENGELINRPFRIFGKNRYYTAVEIATQYYHYLEISPTKVILVSGRNYPDALAAAPVAVQQNAVILLTDPNNLSTETKEYLTLNGADEVIIIGGESAVSKKVIQQIEEIVVDTDAVG